ncbi:MAG: Holliday junction branch migration protein RuvA [Coraliomargarita sp.]
MIARLKGEIIESTPLMVVLEAGGVGYEVHIPVTTAERLPNLGEHCSLFVHSVYREDSATLYGFATREDRDFFRLLISVSGIGPKIGVSMLSRLSVELLRTAIGSSDIARLSKCPGIGRKTAERLVIELKDKVVAELGNAPSPIASSPLTSTEPSQFQDAVASLIALGYKPADADKLARKAASQLDANASVEALIREALS